MTDFYPFLAYVFVTTFTPGPNNILSMSNAMKYGFRNIWKFLMGIFVGFSLMMLLCALLNVVLVSLLPQIGVWLNILGALYMVFLAVHIFRSKPSEDNPGENNMNSFLVGFTLQFMNLKVILYGITIFSIFILPSYKDPIVASLFAPLLATIGFISTSCWAIGGHLFSNLLSRYYRIFNFAMAALLIYTAVASLL